ncbi:MAG: hypothetical protein R3A46_03295 [Thermomicrobiales bacterium]
MGVAIVADHDETRRVGGIDKLDVFDSGYFDIVPSAAKQEVQIMCDLLVLANELNLQLRLSLQGFSGDVEPCLARRLLPALRWSLIRVIWRLGKLRALNRSMHRQSGDPARAALRKSGRRRRQSARCSNALQRALMCTIPPNSSDSNVEGLNLYLVTTDQLPRGTPNT